MKKGISEQKVQRMRNLASGNYNAKSTLRSGYTKTVKKYSEGDVWEENGKTWTIKRGIKRTVNKLDSARKLQRVPLSCPKCNTKLSHPGHKKMYKRWGMCLVCVTNWVNEMKMNGTYDDWFKEFDAKNYNAFINDITHEYNDWLDKRNAKHYITEAGDIEDWSDGKDSKELKKEFDNKLKKAREKRNGTTD
jgi:hypothetical protein